MLSLYFLLYNINMTKHRDNLKLLAQIKPGQMLSCNLTGHINLNISGDSLWKKPKNNLLDSINNSFEHYLNLFELITSPEFKLQSNQMYPNLRQSLEGLIRLTETFQLYRMNKSIIDNAIVIYTKTRNRLDSLNVKYPEFFEQYIYDYNTVEEAFNMSEQPDNDNGLKKYTNMIKQIL